MVFSPYYNIKRDFKTYFVCLVTAVLATLGVANLLRSPTGRAFVAIRDSEISAQSMGIHLAYYKTLSFAISAALAGIGGALYAHQIRFVSPDQFDIIQSIDLLLMVVIGGLGSVGGCFIGALLMALTANYAGFLAVSMLVSAATRMMPPTIQASATARPSGLATCLLSHPPVTIVQTIHQRASSTPCG